ncbi:MAG TPA: hypothetical protein VN635_07780 [Conexibacter sp.]|nr:hypothetical protein [Conexibacter sp.]
MLHMLAASSLPLGLNLNLSHRIRTRLGITAWVVPGDGYICVVQDATATSACDSTQGVVENGISVLKKLPPTSAPRLGPRYLLLGMAPDDVRIVRILPDRGQPTAVPVQQNVFVSLSSTPVRAAVVHGG